MITIGQVAIDIADYFFAIGHPAAHHFMEYIADCIEDEALDKNAPLRYQSKEKAYCKYCYTTHAHWHLSKDHFPPCWICERCEHAIADKFMELEDHD